MLASRDPPRVSLPATPRRSGAALAAGRSRRRFAGARYRELLRCSRLASCWVASARRCSGRCSGRCLVARPHSGSRVPRRALGVTRVAAGAGQGSSRSPRPPCSAASLSEAPTWGSAALADWRVAEGRWRGAEHAPSPGLPVTAWLGRAAEAPARSLRGAQQRPKDAPQRLSTSRARACLLRQRLRWAAAMGLCRCALGLPRRP